VREASAQQKGSAQQAAAAQHEASAQQEQQWAQGLVMQSLVAGQSAGQEWGLQEQAASTQVRCMSSTMFQHLVHVLF
jgi:hypothetical protein